MQEFPKPSEADTARKKESASLPEHEMLTTTLAARKPASVLSNRSGITPMAGLEDAPTASVLFLTGLLAVRKYYLLFLGVALATILGAFLLTSATTKIYQASASIQIDPKPPTPLGRGVESVVELGSGNFWNTVEYYKTQHELLSSQPVALTVVKELGLQHDKRFLLNLPEMAPLSAETLTSPAPPPEAAAELIRARLSVSPHKESRLVEVTYLDANPARAERILNGVLRAYIAYNLNRVLDSTSSAVEWLGEQLDSLRSELSSSELALHEYKLEKQIASLGIDDQTSMLKKEMSQLAQRRTDVRVRIQEVRAALSQIRTVDADDPTTVPQLAAFKTTELASLRSLYLRTLQEYSKLVAGGKGSNHPAVKSSTASLSEIKRSLSLEIRNVRAGSEKELLALQVQEKGLTKLVASAEQEALALNLMEIEYSRLKRTKDNNEKLYSLILERSKEAGLTQMLKVNNIHILVQPKASRSPVEPIMSHSLAIGGFAGILLGFAAAFGRQQMDRSVQNVDELEQLTGLSVLTSIPALGPTSASEENSPGARRAARKAKDNILELTVINQPHALYTESIRTLRTNLLFMSPDKPYKTLLVTSPGAGEGKTTIACSLALSFAQAGKKVLLVDCDLRRARLHTVFPSRGTQSLSENLLNLELYRPDDLLTEVTNLSVLQAGPAPPNPSELLQSHKFKTLLSLMSKDFDLIVLDSSPLIVTDAAIVGSLVDGVLLVVRALQTDRRNLKSALRTLSQVEAPLVGTLFNGKDTSTKELAYGGYYREST